MLRYVAGNHTIAMLGVWDQMQVIPEYRISGRNLCRDPLSSFTFQVGRCCDGSILHVIMHVGGCQN